MKKTKNFIIIFIILVVFLILFILYKNFNYNNLNEFIPNDAKYLVIHSNLLEKKGGILLINEDGNTIFNKDVKLQDISSIGYNDNYVVFSGARANNNILIDKNKNYKTFSFLNEPKYNGVTCVNIYKNNILGIMNGNLLENTYKSLLVLQDKENNILLTEEVDIWASSIIIKNDTAYIFGFNNRVKENKKGSKIIAYDLLNNKIIKEIEDETYSAYYEPIIVKNEIFCIATKKRDENNYLVNIDLDTLNLINENYLDDDIDKIWNVEDKIYAIKEDKFVKLNKNLEIQDEYYKLESESEYSYSYRIDEYLYIYIRNYGENSNKYLGDFIKFNINNNKTEITKFNKDKNKAMENIVFMPTDFFN